MHKHITVSYFEVNKIRLTILTPAHRCSYLRIDLNKSAIESLAGVGIIVAVFEWRPSQPRTENELLLPGVCT